MRDPTRRQRDGAGEAWQAMCRRKSWYTDVLGGYHRRAQAEAAEEHVDDRQHAKRNGVRCLRDQGDPVLPVGNITRSAVTAIFPRA